jgi:hypothetical protein
MNFSFSTIFLLLLSTQIYQQTAKYEKSHPFLLERVINSINLDDVYPLLKQYDIISLRPLENLKSKQHQSIYFVIEDRLIDLLNKNGFNIYERNPHIMKSEAINSSAFKKGARASNFKLFSNKIIGFRIIEFGINLKQSTTEKNTVDREASCIIHLRIIDTNSSEVLYAINKNISVNDRLFTDELEKINKMKYIPYYSSFPIQEEYNENILKDEDKVTPQVSDSLVNNLKNMNWFFEPRFLWKNNGGIGFSNRFGLTDKEKRLLINIFYGAEETGFFTLGGFYEFMFLIPNKKLDSKINFFGSVGINYIKRISKSISLNIGSGFEYLLNDRMKVNIGWSQNIAFENEKEISSTNIFTGIIIEF